MKHIDIKIKHSPKDFLNTNIEKFSITDGRKLYVSLALLFNAILLLPRNQMHTRFVSIAEALSNPESCTKLLHDLSHILLPEDVLYLENPDYNLAEKNIAFLKETN